LKKPFLYRFKQLQLRYLTIGGYFILSLLFGLHSQAQVKADFTSKSVEGCAPFLVELENTSTGTTAAAEYKWELGNGNTSYSRDAAAIYSNPGTYTILLTISENGVTATRQQTIRVHSSPTVNFIADTLIGCAPLEVGFTIQPNPGENTNGYSYFWDFGDGTVLETSTPANIEHKYTFGQYNSVSLVTTNQWGCQTKIRKDSFVVIHNTPKITFSSIDSILCNDNSTIQFINNSTDPEDLNFVWEFGDGSTSTIKNPLHTYAEKGQYNVTLRATNESGCSASLKKENYINVSYFNPFIKIPEITCSNNEIQLKNNSKPLPSTTLWQIEGFGSGNSFQLHEARYTIPEPGTYTVRMINEYSPNCKDTTYQSININPIPDIGEIQATELPSCEFPATFVLKDTCSISSKWEWRYEFNDPTIIGDQRSLNFVTKNLNGFYVKLTSFSEHGCNAEKVQLIPYQPPAAIKLSNLSSHDPALINGCTNNMYQFRLETDLDIVSYKWTINEYDTILTEASPIFNLSKAGITYVSVEFITSSGCKSSLTHGSITIDSLPKFSAVLLSDPEVCGNTPVYIEGTGIENVSSWFYDFGDGNWRVGHSNTETGKFLYGHKYQNEGTYNIKVLASNVNCWDSIEINTPIIVKPPFPSKSRSIYNCENTRGEIQFFDGSNQTDNWDWDFGDGTTLSYTDARPVISHTYTQSGTYNAVLTSTSGSCTVHDTTVVRVLLKQSPRLSTTAQEICPKPGSIIDFRIDKFESNFWDYNRSQYGFYGLINEDGENIPIAYVKPFDSTGIDFGISTESLKPGTYSIRAISVSFEYICNDTSLPLTITVKGPVPKPYFTIPKCGENFILLQDSSKPFGSISITNWEWIFQTGLTSNSRESIAVPYQPISQWASHEVVQLKLTDSEGCESISILSIPTIYKVVAKFTVNPTEIFTQTQAIFNNLSEFPPQKEIRYEWKINNVPYSNEKEPGYTFTNPGQYTIQLITRFADNSCADTMDQIIVVKYQNVNFKTQTGFVKNSGCPPLVVNFNATVVGDPIISWDFGDGSRSENSFSPTHTFHQPGKYYIKMNAIFQNGQRIESIDSVEVKGSIPANLMADSWSGCITQIVQLETSAPGLLYAWDFGDGTVLTNNIKSANHTYLNAGIYQPSLLVIDSSGCRQLGEAPESVIIDSLSLSLNSLPERFCENAVIQLTPVISSVAEQAGHPLSYTWDFGTTALTRFSNERNPVANYGSTGSHTLQLTVLSPLGCTKTISKLISIDKLVRAQILSPDLVCEDKSIQLGAQAAGTNLRWNWNFGNGQTSHAQEPPPVQFNAGTYLVQLYTINQACIDTTEKLVRVSPLPTIQLKEADLEICTGQSIELQATGAVTYSWSPATGLNNPSIANPIANPGTSGNFMVTGTSADGCSATNQVNITVIPDYNLEISPDTGICIGNTVPIRVSGGANYEWIGTTAGLSSISSPNPIAKPDQSTIYRVRSTAAAGCFPKETEINIQVYPIPMVSLGQDITTSATSTVTLSAQTSADVTTWSWSPANFLSCTNCLQPLATPSQDMVYTLEVSNENGCIASDEIKIIVGCDENKVYIPNAFTPNGDGKNDRFQIQATGIKEIESFQIYNRFGQLVYEIKNGDPSNSSHAWDGRFKGMIQASGTYVYFIQLRCYNNQPIVRKGSVVLLY